MQNDAYIPVGKAILRDGRIGKEGVDSGKWTMDQPKGALIEFHMNVMAVCELAL